MSRDRYSTSIPWLWLLLAGALVWWPVLIGGRTVARSELATSHHPEAVEARVGWPVHDSLASARQDECWLVLIRHALAEGQIPLVNPDNGLGAPLLESLQPGVLYPPNLLLLAFDPGSPWMFDAFSVMHVGVLLAGLAVLFRRDAEPRVAVALAILFGLAGVSYQNVNMVHFRGFVWLPWMLACLRGVVTGCRDDRTAAPSLSTLGRVAMIGGLIAATFCSLTAGNLQDAFVSLMVTGLAGLVELRVRHRERGTDSRTTDDRRETFTQERRGDHAGLNAEPNYARPSLTRRATGVSANADVRPGDVAPRRALWWMGIWRWSLLMLGLAALGAPVILPHLAGVANGDLATVAHPDRITEGVPLRWMATWVLPHVMGAFPHQLLERSFWYLPQSDFSTPALWLVVFAFARGRLVIGPAGWTRMCAYGLLAGLALLKTVDTPLFDGLKFLPVVGGLKFHKYNLFIVVLLGSVAAAGLRRLSDGDRLANRQAARRTWGVVAALVAGVLLFLWRDKSWGLAHAGNPAIKWFVLVSVCVSILATLATAGIVALGGPRIGGRLALLWTAHAVMQFPGGWLPRIDRYEDPVEWTATRREGTDVAGGSANGEPGRLAVSPLGPNSNLLFGRAELGVFDPVLNRRFRDFYLRHFQARYADFALHQETPPSAEQWRALGIAGVTDIARFPVGHVADEASVAPEGLASPARTPTGPWNGPVWVLPEEDVATAERMMTRPSEGEMAADWLLPGEVGGGAIAWRRLSRNAWVYELPLSTPPGTGWRLVFPRAYSHAWRARVSMDGACTANASSTNAVAINTEVEPFGELFCSVRLLRDGFGSSTAGAPPIVRVQLEYWPAGLTLGLILLPAGMVLVVVAALGLAGGIPRQAVPDETVDVGPTDVGHGGVARWVATGGMLAAVIGLSTIVRPHESPVSVDPQEVAAHDLRVGERRDGVPSPEWHAELESIDGWSARGHVAVARPAGSRRPVVFRGWVVHDPTRSSPRDVRIQVGDRAWNATSGLIREDRPKRFAEGSYRLCGFLAPLPPEAISSNAAPVRLWVRLTAQSRWVEIPIAVQVGRREISPRLIQAGE